MRALRPATLAATALTLLATPIVACGGDGSDAADFTADAESICIEAARDAQRSFLASLEAEAEDASSSYVAGLLDARESELERLRGLDPPDSQADAYPEYLELRERALEALRGAAGAAATDPTALDRAIGEAERLRRRADEIGGELGFEACASRLGAAGEAAVTEVIEKSVESGSAEEVCRELATERFQALFGGVRACIEAQAAGSRPTGVEIERLIGVGGVSAQATVEIEGGGRGRADRFEIDLLYEDGTWKLERIEPTS